MTGAGGGGFETRGAVGHERAHGIAESQKGSRAGGGRNVAAKRAVGAEFVEFERGKEVAPLGGAVEFEDAVRRSLSRIMV